MQRRTFFQWLTASISWLAFPSARDSKATNMEADVFHSGHVVLDVEWRQTPTSIPIKLRYWLREPQCGDSIVELDGKRYGIKDWEGSTGCCVTDSEEPK